MNCDPDLRAGNGWIHDKLEGMAITADGSTFVVTDNDGVDDSTGGTQFLHLGTWDRLFRQETTPAACQIITRTSVRIAASATMCATMGNTRPPLMSRIQPSAKP